MFGGTFHFFSYSLTPKGQEEAKKWTQQGRFYGGLMYGVPVTKDELVDVTGITTEIPGHAMVDYTWKRIPLDPAFAKIVDSSPHSSRIRFTLYDDGWRAGCN